MCIRDSTGGGTGIMLRDKFKLRLVEGKERLSFVSANGKSTKFVIVYRPPYSEVHPVPTTVFFDEFAVYLEGVFTCPRMLVIAGNFYLTRKMLILEDLTTSCNLWTC